MKVTVYETGEVKTDYEADVLNKDIDSYTAI
jgi:hypothetical protein